MLLSLHECCQSGGYLYVATDDVVYFLLELGGVGSLQEDAGLALLQSVPEGLITASTVGIQRVTRALVTFTLRLFVFLVVVGRANSEGGDALMAALKQIVNAGEVTGIAHVHGIGKCLLAGFRMILARLQVLIEDVVCIVGSYETADGQAHHVAEDTRRDVAEVAAWHANH